MNLSIAALFVLCAAGISSAFVYRYEDGRYWLRAGNVEYWLFDDREGVRIVENPF